MIDWIFTKLASLPAWIRFSLKLEGGLGHSKDGEG